MDYQEWKLPRWLPFLRGVPTPADADMRRREAAALAEERADMRDQDKTADTTDAKASDEPNGRERRRGRRRGKR